jgi:hypothetical protein
MEDTTKENVPEQQTPPAKEQKTAMEKEVEQTPPAMEKKDEQTPPPALASKTKAKKWSVPKLISPWEPKKKTAGMAIFLKGIGKQQCMNR